MAFLEKKVFALIPARKGSKGIKDKNIISFNKNVKIPKRLSDFKKLLNSDNFNRFKCIFLPIDAVLKALKL